MESILRELYTGRLRPFGELSELSEEYRATARQMAEIESEILHQFPKSEPLLNQYRELMAQLTDMSVCAEFELGFRAGAQLMLEMMKPL